MGVPITLPTLVLALSLLATSTHPAQAREPIDVKMTIDRDTTVSDHIFVPENTTLTIKPGVTIRFAEYRKLLVKGMLIAQGADKAPILITGADRAYGSTGHPRWDGLVIYGARAHALLSHVRIEGAYKNLVWEANPVFESCEFVGNHYALYCIKRAAPHVEKCRIFRNVYGIVADYATPLLLDNVITENTIGVYLQLSTDLVAGKNTIKGNTTDLKTEQCLGPTKEPTSLQQMWELMRQIY